MATVSVSLPDEMKEWLDERVKNSRYATAGDYVRDLIRRDHDERAALVKALAEGEQSGTSQRSVREIAAAARLKLLHGKSRTFAGSGPRSQRHLYLFVPGVRRSKGRSLSACPRTMLRTACRLSGLGRSIHHIRPGYFRFPHASHTVFYVNIPDGIRVIRVLHQRMDPERHL
jgi:antitoxin ParD1/3/4